MQNDIFRIIDANLNRAREGLRVIEDWARFCQNSDIVSQELKSIRHEIQKNIELIDPSNAFLLSNRDTVGDVGTKIALPSEQERSSLRGLLKANFCRVQESFRVLEEYAKLLSKNTSFESLRYRVYELEKNACALLKRTLDEQVYILLTSDMCVLPIEDLLKALLESGFRLFQLREKNMSTRAFISLAQKLVLLCNSYDAHLIINDRVDVALASGAHGVHIGENDMSIEEVKKMVPSDFIIGLTIHHEEEKEALGYTLADYLGIGPVFSTTTKPELIASGIDKLKALSDGVLQPVYFIGGINEKNIRLLKEKGIGRVAVCGGVISQKEFVSSAINIKSQLECTLK